MHAGTANYNEEHLKDRLYKLIANNRPVAMNLILDEFVQQVGEDLTKVSGAYYCLGCGMIVISHEIPRMTCPVCENVLCEECSKDPILVEREFCIPCKGPGCPEYLCANHAHIETCCDECEEELEYQIRTNGRV